jgi:hypothetical protein
MFVIAFAAERYAHVSLSVSGRGKAPLPREGGDKMARCNLAARRGEFPFDAIPPHPPLL